MANLIPFRGVLYGDAVVKDIAKVVAPPYDIINSEYQQALHARHPNNIVRLELGLQKPEDGPSDNRYTRAADLLRDWLKSGVLRRDAEPAIYAYTIEYPPPGTRSESLSHSLLHHPTPARQDAPFSRGHEPAETASLPLSTGNFPNKVLKGFLSTVELEEFGTGRIFPHENTRSAAKADRLELLRACRSNFSPIFSLFSDPDGVILGLLNQAIDAEKPRIDFQDDAGCRQRLWSITDPPVLAHIKDAMKAKPLFIADGHHRYETALAYRRLKREEAGDRAPSHVVFQPYDAVLMLFSSLEDTGLTVLPTHRVLTANLAPAGDLLHRLRSAFEIEEIVFDDQSESATRARFLSSLRAKGTSDTVFGLAVKGATRYFLLTLRADRRPAPDATERDKLDVSILQAQVLSMLCPSPTEQDAIVYTKDDHEALDFARQGKAEAALLLNPTKVSEVRAVAASGGRMPHKSTYFFPKPLTGLVINVMQE